MKKGFTLIELLIVIGILAILATTVVLVLNPAQILAESRDTQRVSDFSTIQSAVSLLLSTANTAIGFKNYNGSLVIGPNTAVCTLAGCSCAFAGATCSASTTLVGGVNVVNRGINSGGWIGVDFSQTSGGSALSNLPIDPVNSGAYFYSYLSNPAADTYEIDANLESTKYSNTGASDKEGTDGGDQPTIYEVGNDPGLNM
ncbi:MAG: type II secretion system protein [Candidatus Pacebacteria bacterium]|nr:type II secretion system protein [Candidatus Paceibacterota bacterium]